MGKGRTTSLFGVLGDRGILGGRGIAIGVLASTTAGVIFATTCGGATPGALRRGGGLLGSGGGGRGGRGASVVVWGRVSTGTGRGGRTDRRGGQTGFELPPTWWSADQSRVD